jgi:hypothetical protein
MRDLREYLITGIVVIAIAVSTYQWLGSTLITAVEQSFNLP